MSAVMANLAALFRLQQAESQLEEYEAEHASLEASGDDAAMGAAADALEKVAGRKREAERLLKDAELQLSSLENEKKQKRARLYGGKVTDSKELSQLERDLEMLDKKREKLDEQVLARMEEVEKVEGSAKEKHAALDAEKSRVEREHGAGAARKAELAKAIEEAREKCRAAAEGIEPDLLERYRDIKARTGGVAVVKIQDGNCGGCFMSVSGSALQRAKTHDVVQCGSCGRILVV